MTIDNLCEETESPLGFIKEEPEQAGGVVV